jgi:ATPase involved in DNA repair
MLAQLSVKNLAVVERLDLSFAKGMSVVTGETGAGKSILLQALNLALGGRGDSTLVRHGMDKAEVSASFDVAHHQKIQNYLKSQSLEDEGECILRRIISSDGRSKAFVNGTSVPLSIVKSVGELLIDMHGQNEHQLLLRSDQQRQLLDAYADTSELCTQLNELVTQYKRVTMQIDELNSNQDVRLQQQELLGHQLKELENAVLLQDELDSIESNFKTSANATTLIEKHPVSWHNWRMTQGLMLKC